MRRLPYVQLDVFTTRPLEGNQLAVIPDAGGLSDADMQAIARETNFSETTFIVPRDLHTERERGVQVRIFTIEEELPFAGHPTLGTAFLLHGSTSRRGEGSYRPRAQEDEIVLDLKVGRVPVSFSHRPGGLVFGEMRQPDPEFGKVHDRKVVAAAIGIPSKDIDPDLPIQTVSTGLPFVIVPLRSLKELGALRLDFQSVEPFLKSTGGRFFYFVSPEKKGEPKLRARMIFYGGEDPATGSAAGCLAAWLVKHKAAKPDETTEIDQGVEMKRPSKIYVRASLEGDKVVNVRVGGHAIEVLRGEVFLP